MSRVRAPGRGVESYYESFIGVPRAREDREECRSSSCTGELIASRSLTLRGAHGTDGARGSLRGGSLRRVHRGHAAEKFRELRRAPGCEQGPDKGFFLSRALLRATMRGSHDQRWIQLTLEKSAINIIFRTVTLRKQTIFEKYYDF